jgi:hypothetical protein
VDWDPDRKPTGPVDFSPFEVLVSRNFELRSMRKGKL